MIESRLGLKVFLTRDDDRTLSADERSAFANNHHADVFLSIHANSAVRPSVRGAEVYYLSVERADAEARKRADENSDQLAGAWRRQSRHRLDSLGNRAGALSRAIGGTRRIRRTGARRRVEMSPRAVQQAPFRVLVGANMPAALVEIGYLSNADQETQLATPVYQEQIAQALLDALIKFRELLER